MLAVVDHPNQRIPNIAFRKMLPLIAEGHTILGAANKLREQGLTVPSASRFLRWCMKKPERWQTYTRAQQIAAELEADRINTIADKAGKGEVDPALANAAIQRARLRIDTRKWTMAKRHPSRYGDKLQHEHSGSLSVVVATGVDAIPLASPTSRIGYSLGSETARMLEDATDAVVMPVAQVRSVADSFAALD